jgi:CBS domain-containing protein
MDEGSQACVQVNLSDEDIFRAMSEIPGHLDISLGDFREIYVKAYEQAIKRFTREIKCSEIMTREVFSLSQDDSLQNGALLLARNHFSGAPVVDSVSKVVGVVSQKDFFHTVGVGGIETVMELIAECLSGTRCIVNGLRKGLIRDIMSRPAITASPETSAHDLADLFMQKKINRAPIVDDNGILLGMVTRTDIVRSTLIRPIA